MWGRLRALIDPGVPEPVDTRALRRLVATTLVIDVLLVVVNIASRWALGPRGDVAAYDVFLAFNLPGHAVAIVAAVAVLRADRGFDELKRWLACMIAGLGWTMVVATWLVGGLSVMVNFGFATVMVGCVRLFAGWRLGLFAVVILIAWDAVLGALRVAGALPDNSPLRDYVLDDGGRAAILVAIRGLAQLMMFVLAGYAANRYRVSEHSLVTLNHDLERRVKEQVTALERAGRLRRYMAPQLVDELLAADEDPVAQRDRRPVTVLFADLRGFTPLVERLEPDVLATALNRWFDEVSQVAFAHGGTIDKFIGDAVMVVFGAPRATGEADQARRCVTLAAAIQTRAAELRPELARLGIDPFEVRIGIGSGVATVGTFGASHRADYTVIGVPVNRAARLEPLAPPGRVMIDARTRELVDGAVAIEAFGDVVLKGFARPEAVFLLDVAGQSKQT
jgi:class 3 adenylate cyclase